MTGKGWPRLGHRSLLLSHLDPYAILLCDALVVVAEGDVGRFGGSIVWVASCHGSSVGFLPCLDSVLDPGGRVKLLDSRLFHLVAKRGLGGLGTLATATIGSDAGRRRPASEEVGEECGLGLLGS